MIEGAWFDGRSSQPRPVRLRLTAPGVLVVDTGDGFESVWPVSHLQLSPRVGSTPRILKREGYGQIECHDSPLFDEWFPRGSSRLEGFVDWLERRKGAVLLAAAAAVVLTVCFIRFGIPALARIAAERMPATVERKIADQTLVLLSKRHIKQSTLPKLRQSQLQQEFKQLIASEHRREQMRLHIVAWDIGPNAFTLPDGRIYLSDALVKFARDDEELLAVLAHEAGHHMHRHGLRIALEGSLVFLATGLMFGDVSGSSFAVAVPATLLNSGFSRDHEREADAYAFELLKKRGHSPEAFARIMTRLMERYGVLGQNKVLGYLSTHPLSPERIAAARAAARK